jgi:hypothetical protein
MTDGGIKSKPAYLPGGPRGPTNANQIVVDRAASSTLPYPAMNHHVTSSAPPTLLFVPDISGFTQFVNETEISHSRHIIEELLEVLIDANEIGLSVSEIEGDAILFYRDGPAPSAAELLAQVQRMYVQYHAHLKKYETLRICQCGACSTASGLTLKFIAHYGEVGRQHVKDYSKLFGRNVIVVHRLMKNSVPYKEYVLLTQQLVNACSNSVPIREAAWLPPEPGEELYDFGSAEYCYISLAPLEAYVPEPSIEDYSLHGATVKVLEFETVIEASIDMVFNVVSDLSARHYWMVGLTGSDMLNSKIARSGSTHRCIMKGDESDPFFVSHSFQAGTDYITFTDTAQKQGFCMVFTLYRIGSQVTRLQMHHFMKRNPFKEVLFKLLMKKKVSRTTEASCAKLGAYCKDLLREGRQHPAQILFEPATD